MVRIRRPAGVLALIVVIRACLEQVGGRSFEARAEARAGSEAEAPGRRGARSATEKGRPPAKLIIADDHRLVRSGMRSMLESETDLAVVGEAENGLEAIDLSRSREPDLVLMDVRMPVMDGIEATRALKAELPEVAVLVVTTHESQEYLLEAIRAGAAGYVLKESTKEELLQAVREVLRGELPFQSALAARLLKRLAEETAARFSVAPHATQEGQARPRTQPRGLASVLTPRERDVLRLAAAGKTNREIAKGLHVSLSTVKRHLEHILPKLKVSDRTQAAVKAIEMGLLPSPGREASKNP